MDFQTVATLIGAVLNATPLTDAVRNEYWYWDRVLLEDGIVNLE